MSNVRVRIEVKNNEPGLTHGNVLTAIECDAAAVSDPHQWPQIVSDIAKAMREFYQANDCPCCDGCADHHEPNCPNFNG